jgi:hypothetical protein
MKKKIIFIPFIVVFVIKNKKIKKIKWRKAQTICQKESRPILGQKIFGIVR